MSRTPDTATPASFLWDPSTPPRVYLNTLLTEFFTRSPRAFTHLSQIVANSPTPFVERVDAIHVPRSPQEHQRLIAAGFQAQPAGPSPDCYSVPREPLPPVILVDGPMIRLFLRVPSIADLASVMNMAPQPGRMRLIGAKGAEFWVTEHQAGLTR